MAILVNPRTGQKFDGPDENVAAAREQYGFVTPEEYQQQQEHGSVGGQLETGAVSALKSFADVGGVIGGALGDTAAAAPTELTTEQQAGQLANPRAAAVGKVAGELPLLAALGPAAGAVGGAAAGALGAAPALGTAAGLVAESGALGTAQEAQEAAAEGRPISAEHVAKNGLINLALSGAVPLLGAGYSAVFGEARPLAQAVQSTVQRGGRLAENLTDPEVAAAAAEQLQGKVKDTVSELQQAVTESKAKVTSNLQAQRDALLTTAEDLRDSAPDVATELEKAAQLPGQRSYQAIRALAAQDHAPDVAEAIDNITQDQSLWGDAAVQHHNAVEAVKAAGDDPAKLAEAARGIQDNTVDRLAGDLDQHLDDQGRLHGASAFDAHGSTAGAADVNFDASDYDKARTQVLNDEKTATQIVDESSALYSQASHNTAREVDTLANVMKNELSVSSKYDDWKIAAESWKPQRIKAQGQWIAQRVEQAKAVAADIAQLEGAGFNGKSYAAKAGSVIRDYVKRLTGGATEAAEGASPVSLAGKSLQDLGAIHNSGFRPGTFEALRGEAGAEFRSTGKLAGDETGVTLRLGEKGEGKDLYLVDGRHRLTVAKEADLSEIHGTVYDANGEEIYRGPIPLKAKATGVPTSMGAVERAQTAENLKRAVDRLIGQLSRTPEAGLEAPVKSKLVELLRPLADDLRTGFEQPRLWGANVAKYQAASNAAYHKLIDPWSRIQETLTERTGFEWGEVGQGAINRRAVAQRIENHMRSGLGGGVNFQQDLADSLEGINDLVAAKQAHGITNLGRLKQARVALENIKDDQDMASVIRVAERNAVAHGHGSFAGTSPGATLAVGAAGHAVDAVALHTLGLPIGRFVRSLEPGAARALTGAAKGIRKGLGLAEKIPELAPEGTPAARVFTKHASRYRSTLSDLNSNNKFATETLGQAPAYVRLLRTYGGKGAVALGAGALAIGAGGQAGAAEQQHAEYLASDSERDTTMTARALTDPAYASELTRRMSSAPSTLEQFQGEHASIQQAFVAQRATVQKMLRDPGAVTDALASSFDGVTPELRDALGAKSMQVATYLHNELPPQRGVCVTRPNGIPPSSLEARTYALKFMTAVNPSTAFDDAKRGTLRHEQVGALKANYPELYNDLSSQTLEAMGQGRSSVTQRIRADLLFGFGAALDPAFGRRLSAAAAQARQAQPAKGPGSAPDATKITQSLTPAGAQALQPK